MSASVARQVGARVRALREERILDAQELAHLAGIAADVVALIEEGTVAPSFEDLERVLRPLGCTLDDLVDDR